MIFGIKEKSVILTHTMYCWLLLKYNRATYDLFCGPGSHIETLTYYIYLHKHVFYFESKIMFFTKDKIIKHYKCNSN